MIKIIFESDEGETLEVGLDDQADELIVIAYLPGSDEDKNPEE